MQRFPIWSFFNERLDFNPVLSLNMLPSQVLEGGKHLGLVLGNRSHLIDFPDNAWSKTLRFECPSINANRNENGANN